MQNHVRGILWHFVVALLSALLLYSCAVTPPEKPGTVSAAAATKVVYPSDLRGAQLYRVDPAASSVHILVYRGGSMAKLGHNHVISSPKLDGYVWQHATAERSGFDIVVPVNELVVDDNQARAAEGADFPLNVDDAAKQGTRTNMLSEAVLDGAQFPVIRLKSTGISGAMDAPQVTVQLQIKNQMHDVTLPVTVKAQGKQLVVTGEFEMKQSDFGIKPLSVALGSLTVLDDVKIRFNLVASQVQP